MASPHGKSDAALIAELESEPWRFSFYRAVQLLQRTAPHAIPIGDLGPARREAIRFVHDPAMIFHAADITSVKPRVIRDGVPYAEVTSTFLGLFGPVSPLAAFVSEDVIRAESNDEKTLKSFYDLFHHRVLSLLFRAWRKYRFYAGFRIDGSDQFTQRAVCFVGVDPQAMPKRGLPAFQLLALAPLLATRTRPGRSLRVLLERLFPNVGVDVENFIGRRVMLTDDQIALMGKQNCGLGVNLTIGRSVVDRTGRFRVKIGPVNYELFEGLMPGGRYHPLLRDVVDQFSRGVLEAECEVTLANTEAPRFQLAEERGARLGVTTTLRGPEERPMRARFVMSDQPVVARSMIVDEDAPPPSLRP